ncbi:phosphatase PAP2 family protein [Flavobacterium sp. GSP27]|uniref:Phosphatase PAP2 family protein n=1 Tax=Flavobacterium bomense TaxID=2497483 RepID=A0A3S0MI42_9FLAO|nr:MULTISPECIES: phosphatase PAP2 family protein [Flavobacterium]RTY94064.1 phosphatase PAP2 family protein [Flavobacterium sp. GSN2]RTY75468.1 phosphatase PAP2 family protein [Flavobacterium sp. LS1R10]RTY80055.1 phosphatase PAP2 family protein [Flavobacterium sp. LS1P28]RTY84732.1 phosphatase PAP2 family protein [Flavobacterium sp. ZB4P23]RTY91898.1 phosphatase PAP2 family protein [Flavobacterium sp. RSP46]
MKNKNTVIAKINLIVWLFCMTFVNAQNNDINILRDINVDRNKNLDPTFKLITNSAVPIGLVTPIIIYSVGLLKKDNAAKKQAIFVGEAFLVNAFITTALKHTIKRQRPFKTYPDIDQAASTVGYSFPSGHTSSAFATATSLSLAYHKWYVIAPSFVWASAVGYSRMHLGVHYPSDVVAGAVLGSGSAYLTYKANKWLNKKRSRMEK